MTQLVNPHVVPRTVGFLSEPRVNVFEFNRGLDALVKENREVYHRSGLLCVRTGNAGHRKRASDAIARTREKCGPRSLAVGLADADTETL